MQTDAMSKDAKTALIVARPGTLRSSLFALLAAMREFTLVAECKDMGSLMGLGQQIRPDLVLLELGLAEYQLDQVVSFMHCEWPDSRILILADGFNQQLEAEQAGADLVLRKGCRAAGLVDSIEGLLAQAPNRIAERLPANRILAVQ